MEANREEWSRPPAQTGATAAPGTEPATEALPVTEPVTEARPETEAPTETTVPPDLLAGVEMELSQGLVVTPGTPGWSW